MQRGSLGHTPKDADASYNNLTYGNSATSCAGSIKAKCIQTRTLSVNGIPVVSDCIRNRNNTTSVCVDDSDKIIFSTSGSDRAIFDSDGVFIATAGDVDPSTIIPAANKVAHFEGDINVTGIVDPIGVQYTQQSTVPGSTNVPDKGMLYVSDVSAGTFSNTLVFVDNSDTSHTIGSLVWQNIGSVISPIDTPTQGLLCGDTGSNSVSGTQNVIVGGETHTITTNINGAILAGFNNTITGTGDTRRNIIIGGNVNTIGSVGVQRDVILISGELNTTSGDGNIRSVIIGGLSNTITGGVVDWSFLDGNLSTR